VSQVTKIQWCDASLSPWWGCTKVSPGCLNCYAEGLDARFHGGEHWGKGKPRKRIASFEKNALALDRKARRSGKRLKVFPSMCDPFDPEVPVEWLADFLDVIRWTPNLNWLLLTKRPGLWKERIWDCDQWLLERTPVGEKTAHGMFVDWYDGQAPLNIWIGTSAEDQMRADERIPLLLKIPAKVRFLSIEPMIGAVDIRMTYCDLEGDTVPAGIHWVICGCESGANRRPMKMQWAMDLREQCEAAHVPFFMKQMSDTVKKVTGDIERFPAYLQVREFPKEDLTQ
jgi:protein gp37